MINFVKVFIFDIEVSVAASDFDQRRFGPNTIAKLPDVIRFVDECSVT